MKNLITRYLTRAQPEAKASALHEVAELEPEAKPKDTTHLDMTEDDQDEDNVVKPITGNKKIPDIFNDESSSATVVEEPAGKGEEKDVISADPEVITILDSDVSCDKPTTIKVTGRSRSNSPKEEKKPRKDVVKASPILDLLDDSGDDADNDSVKTKPKLTTPKLALRRKSRPKLRRVTPSRTTQDGIIGLKVRSPNTN